MMMYDEDCDVKDQDNHDDGDDDDDDDDDDDIEDEDEDGDGNGADSESHESDDVMRKSFPCWALFMAYQCWRFFPTDWTRMVGDPTVG